MPTEDGDPIAGKVSRRAEIVSVSPNGWSCERIADLPVPLLRPSTTVVEATLFVIGGFTEGHLERAQLRGNSSEGCGSTELLFGFEGFFLGLHSRLSRWPSRFA